jgi:23S rRNA pseudouridine955/2504/2580 synthase
MPDNIYTVSADESNMRVDRFVAIKTKLTHAVICRILREKDIKVNGKRISKIDHRLAEGDAVMLCRMFKEVENLAPKTKVTQRMIIDLKNSIFFENEHIIAINKPHGLATQSGGGLLYSVDDILRKIDAQYRIVHRLDKETSGLLIVAKTRKAATNITNAFTNREVQKVYLACVSPMPKEESGTISSYIGKTYSKNMHKVAILTKEDEDARMAITDYKVIKKDSSTNCALVEFTPKTGRTHQIRIHANHINCPIIGDYRYGGRLDIGRKLNLFAYKMLLPKEICPSWLICNPVPDFFAMQ